jgi:hypothetical protein
VFIRASGVVALIVGGLSPQPLAAVEDHSTWMQFEVSGCNHNNAGGFLSMRPALFAAGTGAEVRFRNFLYCALL